MQQRFKVGDIVKVIKEEKSPKLIGMVGRVIILDPSDSIPYKVEFKKNISSFVTGFGVNQMEMKNYWFKEKELEPASLMEMLNFDPNSIGFESAHFHGRSFFENYQPSCIKPNNKQKTRKGIMNSLSMMAKKLLDSDTKTLIKARFLDEELNLSEEGIEALNTILFGIHKADMVKLAKESLKEESSS